MPGRKQGKYSQCVRVMRLAERLAGRKTGLRLTELAAELEVTERQIRRDLEALGEAGYDVDMHVVEGRASVRLRDQSARALMVTRRERYTLLAVRHVFDVLKDTPFHEDIQSVFDKLMDQLPADARADMGTLAERFAYLPDGGTKAYADKTDVIDALLDGVLERRVLTIRYRGVKGKEVKGLLAAYGLALYKNGLYVIGHRLSGPEELAGLATRTDPPFIWNAERFAEVTVDKKSRFQARPGQTLAGRFVGASASWSATPRTRWWSTSPGRSGT
jgi:predicted DNA-binding transcriptional regulator YafY